MKLFWDPAEGEEAFNGELGFEDDVGIDVFDDGDEEEGDRLKTFPDISIISRPYNGLYDRSVIFYILLWSLDLFSWLQKIDELKGNFVAQNVLFDVVNILSDCKKDTTI